MNQSITEEEFFHKLNDVFFSYVGVDFFNYYYLFTYSTYFAFGQVDQSAGWIIGEVLYAIFE